MALKPIACEKCDKEVEIGDGYEPMQSQECGAYFCGYDCAVEFALADLEVGSLLIGDLPEGIVERKGRLLKERRW